ncbi:MAG: circadian clock protein KaiB [Verrucomicrobiaceae bacterium]|nr:MAG: circadian clock protein KaiB [Verrucomicrobiaceae bacterium]
MTTDDTNHPGSEADGNAWELKLFVAGQSPKSVMAYANLRRACEHFLPGRYTIELVDLTRSGQAALAKQYQVVAIPTLIRTQPDPQKRIIGSLSDLQRLVSDLELGSPIHSPPTPS